MLPNDVFPNDRPSPVAAGSAYDAVVVGGSAAGAATALLLARRGLRVALLDDGEAGMTALPVHPLLRCGVLQMSRWGLLGEIAAGTPPVRRTTFRFGEECTTISLKPSHGIDALYAPQCDLLDCVLARAAAQAGAEIHRRTAVADVLRRDDRVTGVRVVTATGKAVDVRAAVVIGADGADSAIARAVGAGSTRTGAPAHPVTSGYWHDLDTDGYEWSYGRDARFAVVPTAGGAWVFAAGSIVGGGVTAITDATERADPELGQRLRRGWPADSSRSWTGHHGFIRRSSGPGWALVGEAGCFIDPISPHGFTDALRDAELLAEAVADGIGGASRLDDALDRYQTLRDELALAVFDVVEQLGVPGQDRGVMTDLLARLTSTMVDEVETLTALQPEVTS